MLRIDLHVHSCCSDGIPCPKEIVKAAVRKGLNGVAITDHNTLKGGLKAKEYVSGEKLDFVVIVGEEIRTVEGDVLAYGIEKEIEKGLSLTETLEKIWEQGGIAVAAHPFSLIGRVGIGRKLFTVKFDAVEVMNSRSTARLNDKALAAAKKVGLPGIAGSDAHSILELGNAYTLFEADDASDEKTILHLIRNKKVSVKGKSTSLLQLVGINIYKSALRMYRIVRKPC